MTSELRPLPHDYARCAAPEGCPLASTCRRTTPGRPGYQPYTQYPGGAGCGGYVGEGMG
jgi:hypothetical protein